MTTKKGLHDMGPPIKDEIPGLLDFFATSVISGVISNTGIPEDKDQWDEMTEFLAEFSYVMARAMYTEKYKQQTKH